LNIRIKSPSELYADGSSLKLKKTSDANRLIKQTISLKSAIIQCINGNSGLCWLLQKIGGEQHGTMLIQRCKTKKWCFGFKEFSGRFFYVVRSETSEM
jgi:hypothetical protein